MLSEIATLWQQCTHWLGQHAILPLLDQFHITQYTNAPSEIAATLMIGALQLLIIAIIFRPLEQFIPAEKWSHRRDAAIDFHLTWLMLIGLLPLFAFLILTPAINYLSNFSPSTTTETLWSIRTHFPWLTEYPWLFFILYYLSYDCVYYWMHRLQHALPWWWAMHSLHHSQRQLNCWSNDRTNYLDGILQSFVLAAVGILWGVSAEEFVWLLLLGELVQNFSHANVRIGFGKVLGKILVSPEFHRLHHMDFVPNKPTLHHCNFGQVFAIWDVIFRTALYDEPVHPTGVRGNKMVDIDNQKGIIGIQIESLKRFWGSIRCLDGWRLGGVIFNQHYRPIHMKKKTQQQKK
ncbi:MULTISPECIES: sterol desaturase family protein [unclassified Acinetobacter]|uniref:sterol desaturase family protein n=1 Tax=unclassified Acinetobacter TaxID=196816 RepID=UPI002934CDE5|nr:MULTISPECIES: sterol desaturase family protein [unclassified Acinetobacter]WOE31589.1 sterol desaturase family protein [Acinetobacter sp. SAAs470]WOE39786.1 sterol desaturase family protein [Acinetobacter sp. SAAs474]